MTDTTESPEFSTGSDTDVPDLPRDVTPEVGMLQSDAFHNVIFCSAKISSALYILHKSGISDLIFSACLIHYARADNQRATEDHLQTSEPASDDR